MIFTLSDGVDRNLPGQNAFGLLGQTDLNIIFDGKNYATIDFSKVGENGMSSASVTPYTDYLRNVDGVTARQSGSVIELTGTLPGHEHLASMIAGRAVEIAKGSRPDALGTSFEAIVKEKAAALADTPAGPKGAVPGVRHPALV